MPAEKDTLVAATFGRGVYVMHGASAVLRRARAQQDAGRCDAVGAADS